MKKQMIIIALVLSLVSVESCVKAMPAHLIRAIATGQMQNKHIAIAMSALAGIVYIIRKSETSTSITSAKVVKPVKEETKTLVKK
ncbi:MAG: hypothetical protein P4L22_05620 [Candidatus Babeliales bacterium]|nr:hypothetical protein [Candidatus Babeliales bacterium]